MADRAPWQAPAGAGPAANTDVIDRAARLLGVADVSDRAARALGLVAPTGGATWDIGDRAARQLGVVAGVADQVNQGAVSLVGDTVTLAVRPGDTSWLVWLAASATVAFEVSFDGASWRPAVLARGDSNSINTPAATSTGVGGSWWEAALPAGATSVRARCTIAPGAPPVNVLVATSRSQYEPVVALSGGADVTDRANRALGAVSAAAGATWDVADRIARLLGVVRPQECWAITHEPAANVQATITRAAAAGQHHVAVALFGTVMSMAGGAGQHGWLRLRDGASGVGAVLTSMGYSVPATAGIGDHIALTGLAIAGTTGNAMTLEYDAAPGVTNFETVTLVGYTTA